MVTKKEEKEMQPYENEEGYAEVSTRRSGRTQNPDEYYERGRMTPRYNPMDQERYPARRPRYNQPQGNPNARAASQYYNEYDYYQANPYYHQDYDHEHHDYHHYHEDDHDYYNPYAMGGYPEEMGDYRRGMRTPGYGMGPQGYGMPSRGYGRAPRGYGMGPGGYGMGPRGYGMGPGGYGMGPYGRPMSPWRSWLTSNFVSDWIRSPRAGNIFRGIGIATAGIILAPSIAKAIRPLVVQAVHGAMSVVGEFKGIVADAKEDIEDIFADAKWENMKEDNGGQSN